ncbi:hypothetical protein FDP41_001946 [Naegleria fowleri]|uniref:Uncharacterized protein n=1 Tax=Naegleria fowleri TaxID=5763 RepID=A0A6A5BUG6_NAEFO|nr:uncharacterized protein FDP41_001946 [Naegleria fowleri]KAF0978876.1 hypothetical protein FDP41_001946 [Naegleria fowleri]CAG4711020.1 unnamed protein product [Naegleria fowleri]
MPKERSPTNKKKETATTTSSSDSTNKKVHESKTNIKPAVKIKMKFPCTHAFECTSGEILWGQVQCMIRGSKTKAHDGVNGPTNSGFSGTILQSEFCYRAAARKGKWVVERFVNPEENWVGGFIIHHEDISGKELLERCATVGISLAQSHEDKQIVYVNRYDWSWHSGSSSEVQKELKLYKSKSKKKKKDEDEDYRGSDEEFGSDCDDDDNKLGGNLQLIDASEYDSVMKLLSSKHPEECVQYRAPNGTLCGIHVCDDNTEYELGWLIFSGKKHTDFPESDELVGFIYDSSYCALEGDFEVE